MDRNELAARLAGARVARLATIDHRSGAPHIVPVVYAAGGDLLYSVVDDKPKRSIDLKRLRNIRADARVSLLVDHYDEDWARLWWVRADGRGRVVTSGDEWDQAVAVLTSKYPHYRMTPPTGPAIVITVERLTGWSA